MINHPLFREEGWEGPSLRGWLAGLGRKRNYYSKEKNSMAELIKSEKIFETKSGSNLGILCKVLPLSTFVKII